MLHKASNSKGEMPYSFPRSSIKFQGHTGQNITDFDPNWAFSDYRPVAAFKSLRFALFQIYMNDLPNLSEVFEFILCVDDTDLFSTIKYSIQITRTNVNDILNSELSEELIC